MKHLLLGFLLLYVSQVFSQTYSREIDSIRITMKDTIRTYADFIIKIELAKKNKDSFLFPKNYTFGEDFDDADLLFQIQRRGKKNNFVYYRCNDSPIPIPSMNDNPKFKFGVYKSLILFDSLDVLQCIGKGHYRIRVLYNIRVDGAIPEPPTVFSASNWYEFFVVPQEIILSSYLRMRLKEMEEVKQKKRARPLKKKTVTR
jgi:hypothetical protein